jgi:transposase
VNNSLWQMLRALKVRLYPNNQQQEKLSQVMGSCRWFWNHALNLCNEIYRQTGKGLGRTAINKELPKLKKAEDTSWLGDCYSQCLQSTTLNLTKAFKNFFEGRAKYPKFKSYFSLKVFVEMVVFDADIVLCRGQFCSIEATMMNWESFLMMSKFV